MCNFHFAGLYFCAQNMWQKPNESVYIGKELNSHRIAPQDCFTGYTNMALVSLFRKWKCPVTPKPRPLNVVVAKKIIVLVLVIKVRQHSSYKKNIISSASSKMARVTELTNWLHFNGIVWQVFCESVSFCKFSCFCWQTLKKNYFSFSSLIWSTFIKSDLSFLVITWSNKIQVTLFLWGRRREYAQRQKFGAN